MFKFIIDFFKRIRTKKDDEYEPVLEFHYKKIDDYTTELRVTEDGKEINRRLLKVVPSKKGD